MNLLQLLKRILLNLIEQRIYIDLVAKYRETDIIELVSNQTHLALQVWSQLQEILLQNKKVFEPLDNKALGIFPDQEFYINLILPGAVPYHIKQP